jgi:uncharacterized protein YmfQ (DUF2313 family)
MKLEYVLNHCDECDKENKYNWLLTVKKGYSLTLCETCLDKLTKKLNDYQADKFLESEMD